MQSTKNYCTKTILYCDAYGLNGKCMLLLSSTVKVFILCNTIHYYYYCLCHFEKCE